MRALTQSVEMWDRAELVIPMGTQTLSKSPTQFVQGVSPIYLRRGAGAHVWDVDGNEYIDFPMALGPIILGYCEPSVDEAIRRQLNDGITFTLMHPLEVEVAERIIEMCPGVEAVRFGKTGSDATSAAVRVARAVTGRDHVLVGGYHGWHDWYIGSTSRFIGVPAAVRELTHSFEFNDLSSLERAFAEASGAVGAVVLEPSGALIPADGFLDGVVQIAKENGAVSIFDEIITGFRLGPGGARTRYGVTPDISCYGKALGNGMPISAVAGRWDIMRAFEDVFFSATHGGEALSLAACAAVLDNLADGSVFSHIHSLGVKLQRGLLSAVRRHGVEDQVQVGGEPERSVISFSGDRSLVAKSWVQQCFIDEGVLFNGSLFICYRHTESDIAAALTAFDKALEAIASGADVLDLLRGAPIQPVFRPV